MDSLTHWAIVFILFTLCKFFYEKMKKRSVNKIDDGITEMPDLIARARRENNNRIPPPLPPQPITIKFTCPHCEQRIEAPSEFAGKSVACPSCDQFFSIEPPAIQIPATEELPPIDIAPKNSTALPTRKQRRKISANVRLLGTITVGLLFLGLVSVCSSEAGKRAAIQLSATSGNLNPAWKNRHLRDISLDSPFDLEPDQDLKLTLPKEAILAYEYIEIFKGCNSRIVVTRMAVKEGIPVDLDGATDGGMKEAKNRSERYASVISPITRTVTTIDGLPARRAKFSASVQGKTTHVEAIFIQSGQKVWVVLVTDVADSPPSTLDGQRILDSVHIDLSATTSHP